MTLLWLGLAVVVLGWGVWWFRRPRRTLAPKELRLAQTFHKLIEGSSDVVHHLRDLYRQFDEDVGVGLALGSVLRRRGEHRAAIRMHQSLLARFDLDPVVESYIHAELAADFLASGLLRRASRAMERARACGVVDAWMCRKGVIVYTKLQEWDQAIQMLKTYQKSSGSSQAEGIAWIHVEWGDCAFAQSRFAEAKSEYEKALAVDDMCVPAAVGVSACYRFLNQPKKARRFMQRNRSVFRDHRWLWLEESAAICLLTNQYDGFLADAARLIEDHPDDWRSMRVCADAAMQIGRFDVAETLLRACLSSAPQILIVHQSYWRLIQRHPQPESAMKAYMHEVKEILAFSRPYQCSACGYHAETLHWRCPSCFRLKTLSECRI